MLAHYSARTKASMLERICSPGVRLRFGSFWFPSFARLMLAESGDVHETTHDGQSVSSLAPHCSQNDHQRESKIQAADSNDRSTGDELGRARARRFDGAARWLPTPPARLKRNTRLW
jgi:hypothetical protein